MTPSFLTAHGVEVNVIRGWLGHADLSTTNRYAEINTQGEGGGPPCGGTSGFFGGVPHDASLEVGRVAAQMARIAQNVM